MAVLPLAAVPPVPEHWRCTSGSSPVHDTPAGRPGALRARGDPATEG